MLLVTMWCYENSYINVVAYATASVSTNKQVINETVVLKNDYDGNYYPAPSVNPAVVATSRRIDFQ